MATYEGRTRRAANFLKTIYFDYPDWTHCDVSILPASWLTYGDEMYDVVCRHPKVFGSVARPDLSEKSSVIGRSSYSPVYGPPRKPNFNEAMSHPLYEEGYHTDVWGCVWRNIQRGLDSEVVKHPLDDWEDMDTLNIPNPDIDGWFGPLDWNGMANHISTERAKGHIAATGALLHGFFYMNLYYIRGFENLMVDMATDDPRLSRLIKVVQGYDSAVVRRVLDLGPEIVYFGEDLGTQTALPISPDMWRRFIKPSYETIIGQCRDRKVPAYLHSDGHILEIIPDLIEVGVRVLNTQYRSNGLEGLKNIARGMVALQQDLDRQMFPFGSASEIEDHISTVHQELNLPEGGLMLIAECGPDVPPTKVDVICSALERVCNLPEWDYAESKR